MSTEISVETLKNIHSARGEFYSFLSRLFSNVPGSEFYQMLSDMSVKLKDLIGNTDNEDIINGAEGIIGFTDNRNALSGKELSDFDLETARNYTTMLCLTKSIPTDESIYTSPEHQERQDSYDKIAALFKKYGMKKTSKIPENEDFISYELLFMSKLAYASAGSIDKDEMDFYTIYLDEQYHFHLNHFDKWIYEFFARIVNFGIEDERIYKHFARLAAGFIREDKKMLLELQSIFTK